jgi:hypothetical protein
MGNLAPYGVEGAPDVRPPAAPRTQSSALSFLSAHKARGVAGLVASYVGNIPDVLAWHDSINSVNQSFVGGCGRAY